MARVDELEQYSSRECFVLNGVKQNPHETEILTDNDIQRCHRLKTRRPHHSPVERQSPRPTIIKFVSYRKRQELFTLKKQLKGSGLVLTAMRQAVLAKAKQAFGVRNCWTNDGRIYVSVREKVSVITSEKEFQERNDSTHR